LQPHEIGHIVVKLTVVFIKQRSLSSSAGKDQCAHFAERDRSFRQSVTDAEMLHG